MLIKRPREPLHGRTRGEGRRRAYGRGVSVGSRSPGLELCHESGTFETYFARLSSSCSTSARPLSPSPAARSTRFPRNPRPNEISAPCNAISRLALNDSTGGTGAVDRSGNAQWSLPVSVRPTCAETCLLRSCVAAEVQRVGRCRDASYVVPFGMDAECSNSGAELLKRWMLNWRSFNP